MTTNRRRFSLARDFVHESRHNHRVRPFRNIWFGALLAAGLLVVLPGVAEGIEALMPIDDCADCCPEETNEGECGSFCDECCCCASTPSAVFLPGLQPGPPARIEPASSPITTEAPPGLPDSVYHPPRA